MPSPEPPRVLHVLRTLDLGGVETWLLHVQRNRPRELWTSHFLLHSEQPGAYDDEMRSLGAVLHYCTEPHHPARYTQKLRQLLRRQGPFDVVHSHVHFYSGVVLRAARREGVPMRIAHSHYSQPVHGAARSAYATLMRSWIRKCATHGLAASAPAAAALFGPDWQTRPSISIHEYGIDFSAFASLPPRPALKQQLGIPTERVVVGNVGRFVVEKNHSFLVAVFVELLRAGVDAHLLLVGDGPRHQEIHRLIATAGIAGRCSMVGAQSAVARYFGAMDAMLFPSFNEGLPIAVLEAQAAAVPVLASTGVPAAACVVNELVHFHDLADSAGNWAAELRRILATAPQLRRAATADAMNVSRYGVARSIRALAALYGRRHAQAAQY